jgi:hypothetical protein
MAPPSWAITPTPESTYCTASQATTSFSWPTNGFPLKGFVRSLWRAVPRPYTEGADVIVHYLGTTETGTVERVEEAGRVIVVVTESESVLEFHLMASTHYFTRDRSARLSVR